ncbi:MAG: carbohydrate kinase family protein [Ktedonobacteraceae bacterium]
MKRLDVLSIGEILIDLISDTEQASLADSHRFIMYPGGEVTNVALNVARLGGSSAIVSSVGDDALGIFLRDHLNSAGVETTYLRTTQQLPTTLAVVARHHATPDFTIYRGADVQVDPEDVPLHILPATALVHTSAFALSREPSCSTVLAFIAQAHAAGCLVSFDPNYHPRLWETGADPLDMIARICPYVFLTKPSLDDCLRLFGGGQTPEEYAARFLALGVQQVVLTMGRGGVLFANAESMSYHPTRQIDVVDVTGAGDSFWAGLLLAILDGYTTPEALRVGQAVAEIKLQQFGPLAQNVDRLQLYSSLGLVSPGAS